MGDIDVHCGQAGKVIAVMAIGRVIRFDESKGYGFIAPDDGGEDVFVHANELIDRGLRVGTGTQVEFRIVDGDRGLKAFDVRVLDGQRPPQDGAARTADGLPAEMAGHAAPHLRERSPADDELCEVFAESEFMQQITDLLLTAAPQLTGAAIVELRSHLLAFARKNGWVE
jgi:cold shock protein